MADLITRHGGRPVIAPALREIPLQDNPEAFAFAERLLRSEFDLVIFLTGVGTRFLAQAIETRVPRADWVAALGKAKVLARGPKPVAALRELGVRIDFQVPEPNTWRELLALLDGQFPVSGHRVAVQEYGKPSAELVEGLSQRGAAVTTVPVYRWALPDDTGPLRATIAELAAKRIEVALFTSAQQVEHFVQVAREEGREADMRNVLGQHVIVGSVGPTTSEALRDHALPVDIEPEHPKMGHLVTTVAARWQDMAKVAGGRAHERINPAPSSTAHATPLPPGDNLFLNACRREAAPATPIWLMRQAGRYLPEYRALRAKVSFLDLCKRPELAAEVTVSAAERLGVDAAILFADILLILEPLGFALEFAKAEGPVIHNPLREAADIDRVTPLEDIAPLEFVIEAVKLIRASLDPRVPLIGFAGAPFTLACYATEGGSSRQYDRAKAFMFRDPGAWNALMSRLVDATALYLSAQVRAGAQALQVFDSWVGTLAPDDYRSFVQPHMRRLFQLLPRDVPVIHFGTGTATLLELQRDAGGHVIGLDWRVDLAQAWERLGPHVAVQGNLDPAVLLAQWPIVEEHARRILQRAGGRPGHIFNLGHGVLPNTPVDNVRRLVDLVHAAETSTRVG
jgi:uroporphyrinogen decarboxylase